MIVAFMGNDGSGKTTLAKRFGQKLKALGADVQYRAEFDYFLLNHLFGFLGEEKLNRARKLFLTKKDRGQKPAYFKAWPYFIWLDLFLERLWNKLSKRDRVVVTDRYAYDFLMSWMWLGCSNNYLRWLYTRFPKPDLAFILDASPLATYQRKKADHVYSLRYYEVQRKRYLRLAKALGIRTINTEKPLEECFNEVFTEFRKYFITKLSDDDNVLLFYSFPRFNLSILQELNLDVDWSSLNWNYIVDRAVKCNTENVLCKNILRHHGDQLPGRVSEFLIHVLERSNRRIELLVKTLEVISKKLREKKVAFLLIKTNLLFDCSATDVDILVRKESLEGAQEALASIFKISKSSRTHKAITYQGTLLPVDLHHEISWFGRKIIDEKKVFLRKRKVLYKDVELSVPSREDELLILSAHSLFQHHYTTLGEFLQIVELASDNEADRAYVLASSSGYGWQEAFQSFVSTLLWKHNLIYGSYHNFCKPDYSGKPDILHRLGISPIFFHRFQSIQRRSPGQVLDLFLTLYRSLRFKLSGQLAYNTNWLKMRDLA